MLSGTENNSDDTTWTIHKSSAGSGDDSPDADMSRKLDAKMVMYDSPGITMALTTTLKSKFSIYVVQNFTTWIDSNSGNGERISPVVSWHSIVKLVNFNQAGPDPNWKRVGGGSDQGWRPHVSAPLQFFE
jgi:hypothetical protein